MATKIKGIDFSELCDASFAYKAECPVCKKNTLKIKIIPGLEWEKCYTCGYEVTERF